MVTGVVVALALMLAPNTPSPTAQRGIANTNVGDPNERICETITQTGSRLTTKRFCGTRAEWAEKKLQDRQELEKAQRGPCLPGGGC